MDGLESIEVGPIDKATKSAVVVIKGTMTTEEWRGAVKSTQSSANAK